MKFVIQRVKEASVKVDDEYTGKIKKGYLVLIGVGPVSYTHLTLPTKLEV